MNLINDLTKQKKYLIIIFIIIFSISLVHSLGFEIIGADCVDNLGNKECNLEDGSSFSVKYTGKTSDGKTATKTLYYSELRSTSQGKPKFIFDKEGKIKEAHFKTSENYQGNREYLLGNELLPLPAGSEVHFVNSHAEIKIPQGKEISAAKPATPNRGESTFEFKTPDGMFKFWNGYTFQTNKENSLKHDFNGFYFEGVGKAKLNSLNVVNKEGVKTYLDFKGEANMRYPGAYISIDDSKGVFVTGSNLDKRGPQIGFSKNNPYGLAFRTAQDHIAIQALGNPQGSFVRIQNRDPQGGFTGKVPKVDTLNQFVLDYDRRVIYYDSNENKLYNIKGNVLTDFEIGTSSLPIELHNLKSENNKIISISKYGNVLGIGDDVEWAYGSNPEWMKTTSPYGFSRYPGLTKGFSNSWFYYNVKSPNDIMRFLRKRGLQINDETGILNDPNRARWFTDFLAGLPKPVLNSLRTISIEESVGGYAGLTSPGYVRIASDNFIPSTIRHEITHNFQFTNPKGFWNEWMSVGYVPRGQLSTWDGPSLGFAWGYGSTDWHEDGASYGDYMYNPSYWKNLVSNNRYDKIYRGKLAVLYKYGFITRNEYSSIMNAGGLDSSDVSIQKYIKEAQQLV